MSQLRKQMIEDLELGAYAEGTRQNYINAIVEMSRYFGRSPATLTRDDLRTYVTYLRERRCQSESRLRGHLAAIKFLFTKTLGREEDVSFLSWPRSSHKLPVVLSTNEVSALIRAIDRCTYRTVTVVMYATGLRIAEACALETRDIDASRHVIHVRHGKGRRQRLVPLSPRLLAVLRRYWKRQRPTPPILFPATYARGHVRAPSVRSALRRATTKAKLDKKVTPHVLRHSCATHLLDAGTDIRVIQAILGHQSIRTTMRYTQVSTKLLEQASTLLERLE